MSVLDKDTKSMGGRADCARVDSGKEMVGHLSNCPMYERQRVESGIDEGKMLHLPSPNDEPEKIGRRTIPAQLTDG